VVNLEESTFLQLVYHNCQDCIKMMDQKLTVLVAVLAILITVTGSYGNNLASAWVELPTWPARVLAIVLGLVALLMLISLFLCGLALLPRKPKPIRFAEGKPCDRRIGHMFWALSITDRQRYPTFESYAAAVHDAPAEIRHAELAYETMVVAGILARKITNGGLAIKLFIAALLLLAPALFFLPYVHSQARIP